MKNSIIAICLIALAFAAGRCSAPRAKVEATTTYDTIPGDSVPYEVRIPVPTPKIVMLPQDTFFRDVDTAAILLAYYSRYHYSDTLKNDTSAFIALNETITHNRIVERNLLFQNRRPTAMITHTTIAQPPPSERKLQFYGHVFLGKEITAPVLQVGWRDWQISAGYNLQQNGVIVGLGYRIR